MIDTNKRYYNKGHITVFLSLILTLILSVVCTTIESARIQGVRMQMQNITDMAIFSAFGEYDKELLETYDLFFIDMGYGTKDATKERVNARIKEFATYNTNVNKGLDALTFLSRADMWKTGVESVATDKYLLASDYKGKPYFNQAVSYMEKKLGIDIVKGLVDQYDEGVIKKQEEFKSYQEEEEQTKQEIEAEKADHQAQYDLELAEKKDESLVTLEKPSEVSNPVDTIDTIKGSPILQLVVKDESALSKKKIKETSNLFSKRKIKKGNGEFLGEEVNPINKALFNEYIFDKFPTYLTQKDKKTKGLQYQTEYILCGKSSDKANLEAVSNKLLLIREGINLMHLLSDSEKKMEATLLATLIVGYLGPAFVTALKIVLLLAWSFAESVLEVRMLLEGKKVSLIKNNKNWNLDLDNLANLSNMLDSGKEDKKGIDYEGYLRILLYFSNTNKLINRSLDMIELTMQKSNANFRIDNCTQSFTTTIQYKTDSLFLRLPFKTIERGESRYQQSVTREFSYD